MISIITDSGTPAFLILVLRIEAIIDYINKERKGDFEKWQNPALFLVAKNNSGRLTPPNDKPDLEQCM
ncbi:MAG: hypothetical protein GY760_23485 [Deltaproteobacteria bacterium]|nr:hypothetical protein [Deltaproteobacteria bacterium]